MAMALQLGDVFQGRTVPSWLRRFEKEPGAALHDLLLGRASLGHLNPEEPALLLRDWLEGLGDGFARSVDVALAAWIEGHWGQPALPRGLGERSVVSVRMSVGAWQRAFDVIGFDGRLVEALAVLRRFMPAERSFLAAMREGSSHDPESRALLTLALHQTDRSLAEHWWRLCNLPPEMPWHYGEHGVRGLVHMPAERPGAGGGFPYEAAEGLVRLGAALVHRIDEGWIGESEARDELLRTARRTMWAFNLQDRWVSFWRQTLPPRHEEDGVVDEWIRQLFPEKLKKAYRTQRQRQRHLEPDPEWRNEIPKIVKELGRSEKSVMEARNLLTAQARYAETTGDTHFVVRTACNFAGRVRRHRPAVALEWTRLARRYDPGNAYAWTTEAAVLLELDRRTEAARTAFEAVRLFPYDPVARTGLGEVLKAQGRLDEAEDVYREAVRRFPGNPVARNGLGEVLKAQGRLDEAEDVYRETVRRFPDNPVARTGLGEVLKAQGRLDEAEDVYREAVRRFPDNPVARTGLAQLLSEQWCLDEAEDLYRSVLAMEPGDSYAKTGLQQVGRLRREPGLVSEVAEPVTPYRSAAEEFRSTDVEVLVQDAFLLRHWARHRAPAERQRRARELLTRLADPAATSPAAASERGLLELDVGELEEARKLLRLAAKRFPGSARVRYALARAERAADAGPQAWKKLGRIDRRLRPVQLLGAARSLAGRSDEASRTELRERFGELGYWIEHALARDLRTERGDKEATPFHVEWARELKGHVFGEKTVACAEDVEDLDRLCRNLVANDHALDYQEEIWVG